ncbi:MAG: Ig-like domain-containing protein, partial [Pseudomonadota bacterium]
PNPDFNGVETITYVVSEDTLGVTETGTISVTVTPVNDAPMANDDVVVTDAGRPTPISVLNNDTDVDMDSLAVVSASAANGTVAINANGTVTYQSAPGFVGRDTISYKISDGNGGTDEATVTIVVRPFSHIAVDSIGPSDPAPQPSVSESMNEDGAVLDALREIGGKAEFADVAVTGKHVLFAAELKEYRVAAILDQPALAGLDLSDPADRKSAQGHSLQFPVVAGVGQSAEHANVVLDTVVLGDTLVLAVSVQNDAASGWLSNVRIITETDGDVPNWLDAVQPTLFTGKLPLGVDGQQLRLIIEHADGSLVHQTVHLEFASGMTHIVGPGMVPGAPSPFQAQFNPINVISEQAAGQLEVLIKNGD